MEATPQQAIELPAAQLEAWLRDGDVQVVDVRAQREYEAGHLAGSRQIEFDEVSSQASSLDKGQRLIFVCRSGNRSEMMAEAFRGAGYDAYHLTEGLLAWAEAGLPLEPEGGEVVKRSVADL